MLLLPVSALALLTPLAAVRQAPTSVSATPDAIRLNNLGVASMNQQKFEEALPRFEQAQAADPSLAAAKVNQAIALLALQRFDAAEKTLEAVLKEDETNARAWYTLGLLHKSLGDAEASLAAFRRVAELRPRDAHSHYFAGLLASQLQQYEPAVASFTRALEVDPFLVSAEFGLARAYQRLGRPDDSKQHMERFTRLTQEKIASAMSLAYGDQGPLSLATPVQPAGRPAVAPLRATFAVTDLGASLAVGPSTSDEVPETPTGGACVLDVNNDGAPDYLALDPASGAALFLNRNGRFARASAEFPGTEGATACAVGDVNNDERADVVVSTPAGVRLFQAAAEGAFSDVSAAAGLGSTASARPAGLALIDYDHDADLDLIVASTAAGAAGGNGLTVWRNNGDGTFADVTRERGFADSGPRVGVVGSDLNNDRAIDLVTTGSAGPAVFVNPREGAFRRLTLDGNDAARPTRGVVVFDFDKDGWMDLAFTHEDAPAVSVYRNLEGARFEALRLPPSTLTEAWGLAWLDLDNDGWLDLAAAGAGPAGGSVAVWRNTGGTFAPASSATSGTHLESPRALLTADYDTDGDADLIVTQAGGAPVVVRNDGGSDNSSIRLSLAGLNDNRSGHGTKVEVQGGTVWQKFETVSSSGYLGSSSPVLIAGLGDATHADVVRLLWPTGVVQDEVELAAGRRHEVTQIDRRGSSCPVLFSWNGTRYAFIADAIGPAVVGHWVGPDTRNIPDVDELVKVEGRHVQVKDGRLSFRFAEPMEEVIYLDQVKLFAIDHPEGTDVYPNEYFAALPPHPADRTIASREARLPLGAWDTHGADALPALRARDRAFVDTFEHGGFKGFAKLHSLELDLGPLEPGAPVRLLMHGFTDYFTATSVFAAHQAKLTAIVPYVEAQRPDGTWEKVIDDIGFPAGLLRTMTADLSGKLPAGTERIRIWTNLKVYWDQILIDTTPGGAVPVRRTEIPLAEASLAYRGFPREITGTPVTDLQYRHDEVSPYGPYARHTGFYTKYGPVTPLLTAAEDRFVIFGAGDEVALEFDAGALPALPGGWTRDYFVYLNGFVKDMDFYAAHAQTVAPLPFKDMPGYPYGPPASYPERHHEYLLEWNTREVSAEAWPTYRFEYDIDH